MTQQLTIRAWKDERYRQTLAPEDQAALAISPVGPIDLDDADLGEVVGGEMADLTQTTICGTGLGCFTVVVIAVSKNISCGACDATLWSGSCYVSSVGCCP
jgi:mersacidin/lichenicidin family type 2 lantibiotic